MKESDVANCFNNYFYDKIENLKNGIDNSICVDPLFILKNTLAKKHLNFKLKTVSTKTVKKAMKSMRNKKSSGHDKISQDIL